MQNSVNNAANSGGEAIKLLELSSSDSLDSPNFANFPAPKPKRKVRFKKVFRPGSKSKAAACQHKTCNCQVIEGAKLLVCFLLLALVAALVWYVITLSLKIQELQAKFNDIEAANKNTPEILHSLHYDLQNVEANVTALFIEMKKNVADVNNATKEIEKLKIATSKLQDSVDAAPALKQLPKNVESLSESVATFGSKISALESSMKEMKDAQSSIQVTTQNLFGELDTVKASVHDLVNATKFNSSEMKSPYMPLARDLTYQSAIQETKQRVSLLQNELLDLVRSVDKINSTLSNDSKMFSDLSVKVETVNDAFIWINNNTHSLNARMSLLEDFVFYNLTQRFGGFEINTCKCSNMSEIQNMVNKTITNSVLNLVNSDFQTNSVSFKFGNQTDIQRAQNTLLLLRSILSQFSQIPVQQGITEEKAGEIFAHLLNNTCFELHKDNIGKPEASASNTPILPAVDSVNRGTIQADTKVNTSSDTAVNVHSVSTQNKNDTSFQVVQ